MPRHQLPPNELLLIKRPIGSRSLEIVTPDNSATGATFPLTRMRSRNLASLPGRDEWGCLPKGIITFDSVDAVVADRLDGLSRREALRRLAILGMGGSPAA